MDRDKRLDDFHNHQSDVVGMLILIIFFLVVGGLMGAILKSCEKEPQPAIWSTK